MPLNINSSVSQIGVNGISGGNGATGTSAVRNGGPGGHGTAAESVFLDVLNQTFTGDDGADNVAISRTAGGGTGGAGGTGGTAAAAGATTVNSSGPDFSESDTVYSQAGHGGIGGRGGLGGTGQVEFAALDFDLGGGAAGRNNVTLGGTATGGRGGHGGSSGPGGNSGWDVTSVSVTSSPGTSFSNILYVRGTPAGVSPNGRDGKDGRIGKVDFSDISVIGDYLRLILNGSAYGGVGGNGGYGSAGSRGDTGAAGGNGGNGGNGGSGAARVAGIDVNVTGGLSVIINLYGEGGAGGGGNSGGNAGWGRTVSSLSENGEGAWTSTTTYARSGDGGDGGDGGLGAARMTGSAITGSDAVDSVDIGLRARGGSGANGNIAGAAVPDSTTTTGTIFTTTEIVVGTNAGAAGSRGAEGQALVVLAGNDISLAGGADILTLRLTAEGPGPRLVKVSDNAFDGGAGIDQISVGANLATDRTVVFDVYRDRLSVNNGSWNAMTNFEIFEGGSRVDRFIDGEGDQSYRGFLGSDRFVFRAGEAGDDTIVDFTTADVIRLIGFGPQLDSFEEVLDVTTDTAAGAVIATGGASSVLVAGVLKAALAVDDFTF